MQPSPLRATLATCYHTIAIPGMLLALLALLLFAAFATPPTWKLDMGSAGDTRFSSGFFLPERHHGTTFRWSGPESRLMLHGAGAAALLFEMRLHGDERVREDAAMLRILQAGDGEAEATTLAVFALDAEPTWRSYRVVLPPGAAAAPGGEPRPLTLLRETYRPGADDGRDLGVPIDQVQITPLPHHTGGTVHLWGAARHALSLTWMVAVAGALLWLPIRGAQWRIKSAAALLVGMLALLLLWWAHRNPYTLAWALPPVIWLPGLATVVLLALGYGGGRGDMALLPVAVPAAPRYPVARWHVLIVLLCIVLLALGLRLYRIDALPYSLWRDEARHGQVALRMLENPDYRPVYEPRWGIDLPGLGFYPFALALRLWGIHAWSLRVMTAIAGALTVLPLYALVACLTARRDVALLAAALLAVSSWHISISRLSFPTIFEPLLTLTALWLLLHPGIRLVRGIPTRTPVACGAFVLAGALLGMAAQTYHTGRMAPLLAVVLLLALFAGSRARAAPPAWSRWRWLLLVGSLCLGFLLVTAPLLWYAFTHPHDFQSRVGAVFLLSAEARRARAPLAVLDESLGRHLLMFNVRGDANGRHHAPGQPLLDVVSGAGFVVGCGLLLWQWRNWRAGFLLAALGIGVLPSLLAVEGPHAMRSIGAAAFACAIAAIGWGTAAHMGWQRLRHRVYMGGGGCSRALLAGVVALALLLNAHTYFVDMARDRAVWVSSYPVHTRIGSYLRQVAEREGSTALERIYIPEHLSRNAVLGYLTHGLPVRTFDTATLAHTVEPGSLLVLSGYTYRHDVAEVRRSLVLSPQPVQYGAELPGTGEPSFVVYRVLQSGQ